MATIIFPILGGFIIQESLQKKADSPCSSRVKDVAIGISLIATAFGILTIYRLSSLAFEGQGPWGSLAKKYKIAIVCTTAALDLLSGTALICFACKEDQKDTARRNSRANQYGVSRRR